MTIMNITVTVPIWDMVQATAVPDTITKEEEDLPVIILPDIVLQGDTLPAATTAAAAPAAVEDTVKFYSKIKYRYGSFPCCFLAWE